MALQDDAVIIDDFHVEHELFEETVREEMTMKKTEVKR